MTHLSPPIPATASVTLRDVLRGPRQTVRLLGVTQAAAYFEIENGSAVIALVTPRAVRLPNAVVVDTSLAGLVGQAGSVGVGRVALGDRVCVPLRWWDPRPRIGPAAPPALGARLEALELLLSGRQRATGSFEPELRRREAALSDALAAGDVLAAADAAEALIGLGPGLTPAGDDVVAGALATLRLLGPAAGTARTGALADALAAGSHAAADRTTSLSAVLLRHADAGEVAAPAAGVFLALIGRGVLKAAVRSLLAVGHTSGHDLARGIVFGGRATVACTAGSSSDE